MDIAVTTHAATAVPAVPEGADAPADGRFRVLRERVASGDYDVLSLDVFDTLVWRRVPAPTDVHLVTARLLRGRGQVWESSTPESFGRERTAAEDRARRKQPSREVTLAEIWAEFPQGYLRGIGGAEGAAAELEAERLLVRPNADVVALVHHARAHGLKLALVSDTYFTSRDIAALVPVEPDWIVTSCEHRCSKSRGLHRVLLESSGVPAGRVLHVGDNHAADVEGPEPLGLHRFWLPRFPDGWEDVVEHEMPRTLSARAPLIPDGDDGLTALRGRAMFACRTPYERWGAGVLGPLVGGFADWVASRCADIGATTVLCLMREGRMLRQAIDATGAGLDTRECYLSRFTALRAAITDASASELSAFLYRPSTQTRDRVLRQVGLTLEDFGATPPPARLEPAATNALIGRIAREPALRRKVCRIAAEARANLMAHLDGLVATRGPATLALVDLGYKGSIQGALQRVLDRERPQWRTHGLYLVTGGGVGETQSGGVAVEGWLAENGQPIAMAHTFMRSPEIVEQSLMADCGTTLGHRPDGTPVLDALHIPEDQRAAIAEVQRGLRTWCRLWAEHRALHGPLDAAAFLPLLRAIAIRAVARPLPVELELFGDWRHDENFGSADVRGIAEVKDLHPWEALHLSAHQLASLPQSRVHWPFGFAHRVSQVMGEAVAHIYLRTVEPHVFDSALHERPLVFYWDDGRGITSECSSILDYRLGNRGRAWVRASVVLRPGACRGVAFSLGVPGELVRIAGMRTHLRREGEETVTRDHPPETLGTHALAPLAGGLFQVVEDPALVLLATPEVAESTGVLDVDLFFTLLEAC
jgi:FMN phosphatase YigB (HAD superfamily)